MKKGFTLVELAIVLVIIGLIMGMAIKGKSLIDVAIMMKEVSKMRKIDMVFSVIDAEGVILPIMTHPSQLADPSYLFDKNLLTPNDLNIKYIYLAQNYAYMGYPQARVGFLYGLNNAGRWWGGRGYIGLGYSIDMLPSQRFACSIEVILDDSNLDSGDTMSAYAANSSGNLLSVQNGMNDCYSLSNGTNLQDTVGIFFHMGGGNL